MSRRKIFLLSQGRSGCARVWATLALCLAVLAPAVLTAGETPPPVDLYASTSSLGKLLRTVDAFTVAALRGTSREKDYEPGAAPAFAASLGLPWLFDNDDVTLGFVATVEGVDSYNYAFLLNGVDLARLADELPRLGIPAEATGDSVTVRADVIAPGKVYHLIPGPGGKGVLAAERVDAARRLRDKLGGWNSAPPSGGDVMALANLSRLRTAFPEIVSEIRREIEDPHFVKKYIDPELPRSMPPKIRNALSGAVMAVLRRVCGLVLDTDVLRVDWGVDGGMISSSLALTPTPGGEWDRAVKKWARNDDEGVGLARAATPDALIVAVDLQPEAGVFPGGLPAFIGLAFADKMFPADDADLAAARGGDNPLRETVSSFHRTPAGPVWARYSRAASGRGQVNAWLSAARLFQRFFQNLDDGSPRTYLTQESGKFGKAAYHLVRTSIDPAATKDPAVMKRINEYRLYLASNRNTMVSVVGPGLTPDSLLAHIDRLGEAGRDALVDGEAAHATLEKLTPRNLRYGLLKSSELYNLMTEVTAPDGSLDFGFQDSGDWSGWSMGVRDGEMVARHVMTLATLNDLVVNTERMQGRGHFPDTPPIPSDDDWGGDDTRDDDDWGGDTQPIVPRPAVPQPTTSPSGQATLDFLKGVSGGTPPSGERKESPRVARLRRQAEGGDGEAQFDLALVYDHGTDGMAEDPREAEKWYKLSMEQDYDSARHNLGVVYVKKLNRPAEGIALLEEAAGHGFALSARVLGKYHRDGTGVPADIDKAIRWFKQGVDGDDDDSCFCLGVIYQTGDRVEKDPRRALEYYRKGEALGNIPCVRNIGLLHENGGPGIAVDFVEATARYVRAGDAGDGTAQYWAGINYFEGKPGVPQDLSKAKYWLTLAVANGVQQAQGWLDKIPDGVVAEKRLTPRLKAADLIREFDRDPAAALAKYRGQRLELVMGEVDSTVRMLGGSADVTLSLDGGRHSIRCRVVGKGGSISLNTGEGHLLKGECVGLSGQSIDMGDCENLPL